MITRIDVEQSGKNVLVRSWEEGWVEGDPADQEEYRTDITVQQFLLEFDEKDWVIQMPSGAKGRALRGEITRIDFLTTNQGVIVRKYPYGWTALTRPLQEDMKPVDFDIETAVAWCKENGWTVHRWLGGARAWKGKPLPVRDRGGILAMRRWFNAQARRMDPSGPSYQDINLAYDY